MHIQKATKYLEDIMLKKQCMPFFYYSGRDDGVPQPSNSTIGPQESWPQNSAKFCCMCFKMQGIAEHKGLDVGSLVNEPIQRTRPQDGLLY